MIEVKNQFGSLSNFSAKIGSNGTKTSGITDRILPVKNCQIHLVMVPQHCFLFSVIAI
uniref:Uncharacterized protein n=1 Tax=Arundo donax TaxID=35708 RepID=A0A0A9FY22_ARUDO